jgi:hypothetical protein
MSPCQFCSTETTNEKFCSRSCAAKHNNKHKPKRKAKPRNTCPDCNSEIDRRATRCIPCANRERGRGEDITLDQAIYSKGHRSSAYALVRTRARALMTQLRVTACEECGYDKHVEIAHIQGISTFSGDTLISEINRRENLKALCPNCHWEFDHPN